MTKKPAQSAIASLYQEPHRPQYHFSPPQHWMNDPNGLIYLDGIYHLFYQYNPSDKVWGNIGWGHATSTDLLHWQHHPAALEMGTGANQLVFSGCAVFDENNTSNLGSVEQPPLIAFFTWSGDKGQNQRQAIAFSLDKGMTWQQYPGNPILENPGFKDFRDPKVFWYAPAAHWVMLVAADQSIYIYTSSNLIDWTLASKFGEFIGWHGGDWECPDLFMLTEAVSGISKWVFVVSISPGGPNGGCATQYFVGEFDGQTFSADSPQSRWLDWGPDSYAGATWNPVGQAQDKYYIAWMNNWLYAQSTPTHPWRGQMTLPRKLSLAKKGNEFVLLSAPLPHIDSLRETPILSAMDLVDAQQFTDSIDVPECFECSVEISMKCGEHAGLSLSNSSGEILMITLDSAGQRLVLDRHKTMNNPDFLQYAFSYYAHLPEKEEHTYTLRLFKDKSSLEIFVDHGETLMTSLVYSQAPLDRLNWHSESATSQFKQIKLYPLKSVWNTA